MNYAYNLFLYTNCYVLRISAFSHAFIKRRIALFILHVDSIVHAKNYIRECIYVERGAAWMAGLKYFCSAL